jgi:hypothetical protein
MSPVASGGPRQLAVHWRSGHVDPGNAELAPRATRI